MEQCEFCGNTVAHVNQAEACNACAASMTFTAVKQEAKKAVEDKDNQEFMLAYFGITLEQFEVVTHDNLSDIVDSEFVSWYKSDAKRVLWHEYRANAFTKKGDLKKAVEKKINAFIDKQVAINIETKQEDSTMSKETKEVIATDFDHNYHNSEKRSSNNVPEYVRHNLDVYNEFMGMSAVYQNAQSYIHGDYSTPSTQVELSLDGGTDSKLIKLNELYAKDFENEKYIEYLQELIEELALDDVKTIADLHEVYINLIDNNSRAQQYADNLDIEPVFINDNTESNDDY